MDGPGGQPPCLPLFETLVGDRLKAQVKSYVDGKMSTLEGIVLQAVQTIDQAARLSDTLKRREVMAAYRSLAASGESVTADRLNLWEAVHKKHRVVHNTEITDLLLALGMSVAKQSETAVKTNKSSKP